MDKNYAVRFKGVSKIYKMDKPNEKNEKIETKFYALKDISFEIPKGESVGILGTNGSGKSTLSKILAGIALPDEGKVEIIGEPALIAISSGLNNKLTGLENIELKGVLLGFSKERIKEITDSVIEFSELGDFIYQPVKKYSSGMKSRLGFSISINMNPDIIIVDEALSVGDKTFNEKCLNKINEMKARGKTIFFISHSVAELKKFCEKGIWIEGGILKEYDTIDKVARGYYKYVSEYKEKSKEEQKAQREAVFQNRIIETVKKSKENTYKQILKNKRFITILAVMLMLGGVFIGGTILDKQIKPDSGFLKQEDIINLETNKNYIFVTTGNISEEQKEYRNYIEVGKPIIKDIVEVSFNKDGKSITITNIPANLQYYYDKEGISDELSYYYQLNGDNKNLISYLEKVTENKIDGIYQLDDKQISKANNLANKNNNTDMLVNLGDFDKDALNKYISIISKNGEELVDSKLTKVNKDDSQLSKVLKVFAKNAQEQAIKFTNKELELAESKVSRLLNVNIIITNTEVLDNIIVYIDGLVDPTDNIFVKRYYQLNKVPVMNNIDEYQYEGYNNSVNTDNNGSDIGNGIGSYPESIGGSSSGSNNVVIPPTNGSGSNDGGNNDSSSGNTGGPNSGSDNTDSGGNSGNTGGSGSDNTGGTPGLDGDDNSANQPGSDNEVDSGNGENIGDN